MTWKILKIAILAILVCVLQLCAFSNSLQLDSDGGYNIVVAFDEKTPVPAVGAVRYKDNIKNALQVLSNQMWRVTKGQFFINSVDLLIPSGWDMNGDDVATTQSFPTADLRLAPSISYPHAENNHPCGEPGEYIELPLSFFTTANDGPYGSLWKALINQWARYRWGVWDEHGYPGNNRFPYTYRTEATKDWVTTGCSDVELEGRFIELTNPDNECNVEDPLSPPETNCRFLPDTINNTATTSLMHFHWIESVDSFCDETNHNRLAPNKQNIYCNYRSVWEVIRETPDFKAVNTPRDSVPFLKFKVVKPSAKPLFYLLIDTGRMQGELSIANRVPVALTGIFDAVRRPDTIATIGTFPGNNSEGSYVQTAVDWSPIGANQDSFLEAIGNLETNGPIERDFGLAIYEAIGKVKARNPMYGAVILVVKFGAGSDTFANMASEAEILSALSEEDIILCSIEVPAIDRPVGHLVNLARESQGAYSVLSSVGEAQQILNSVINYVNRRLDEYDQSIKRNLKTIYKGWIRSRTPNYISLPTGLTSRLQIYYTAPANTLTRDNFVLRKFDDTPVEYRLTINKEWNEDVVNGTKYVYTLEIHVSALASVTQLVLQVNCLLGPEAERCNGLTVVRGEFQDTQTDLIEIAVTTSASDNTADLSRGLPLSIFAKVTKEGKPIQNVRVRATVLDLESSKTETLSLVDNGLGSPDVERNDGVYSAYYAPTQDGSYKISVMIQNDPTVILEVNGQNTLGRLLPIDQVDFGCVTGGCDLETLTGTYARAVDLPVSVYIKGTNEFKPAPSKVYDLVYSEGTSNAFLLWTSPIIPGLTNTVTRYEIKTASTKEELLENFDDAKEILSEKPILPGRNESLPITKPTTTTYYGLRAIFEDLKGVPSNIVGVEVADDSTSPATEDPIPSTTEDTIPVTTEDPNFPITQDPGATEPESGSGTTPVVEITTVTGPPTTQKPKEKVWIKKPAGYITVIVIILAVSAFAAACYWYMKKRRSGGSRGSFSESQEVLSVKANQITTTEPLQDI